VNIASVEELDRFVDQAHAKAERPTAVSVDVHRYRVDLLVGHDRSFVHMAPEDPDQPYYVTVGGTDEGDVDFWLHAWHHTCFENRHLVSMELAREAFREFFRAGTLSQAIEWEQYFA
jgi:immunity protein Imm1 of predicted polymorphic toxin system